MKAELHEFALNATQAPISPGSMCYRPPHWPPPDDWVVSLEADGKPLSRWGDPVWDFSPWVGRTYVLNFSGGQHKGSAPALSHQNQSLMRILATLILWGPMRGGSSWGTLYTRFHRMRRIVALCDENDILASDLSRFPSVQAGLPKLYKHSPERRQIIVDLDRLLRAKGQIGFTLLDAPGISRLSKAFLARDVEETEQTAYIPPRIWVYCIDRLELCLGDFLEHSEQVENCFNFCVDAYAHNYGSLEAAVSAKEGAKPYPPFTTPSGDKNHGSRSGRQFHGTFELTAHRFGILHLLKKWVRSDDHALGIKSFSAYLTLIQNAGLAYIATFTLQRISEVASLRSDCLKWEEDADAGRFAVICGETTKTDPDSDARWPTSPSVESAVKAMSAVARLRIRCASANSTVGCSKADRDNPLLSHRAFEPWCHPVNRHYSMQPNVSGYHRLVRDYPLLFDENQLRITKEDLDMAKRFTPNLDKGGKFKVGEVWPLAHHQLRRTSAVNMYASGLLSDSSIQVILKHCTILQGAYYGRNHTRLRFNEEVEQITTSSMYEVLAHQIEALVADRYVSPLGPSRKEEILVNLISTKDFKALVKAGERGEVSFRETRLGGCARNGHCDYGGIESVAHCAGGSGRKPCRDAIFDREKKPAVEKQLASVDRRVRRAKPKSPLTRSLQDEAQGLRSYLDVINN